MTRWFPVKTERLLLREFRAADEADIHAYACDPEVVRLMIWGPNTTEMTRIYLDGVLEAQQRWPRPEVALGIELMTEGHVIGSIVLRIKDEKNSTADIGYVLTRSYWGHGYTVEAARAVLDAAFREVGLHRVWATCDPRNHASCRVMEKLGMRREAHFRKDVMEKGEWRDSYLYAILREEWPATGSTESARRR
jgi:[ribosomal protein S5]-alanine N-acetyltransferase